MVKPTHIGMPGEDPIDPFRCETVNEVLTRVGDTWSVQIIMQLGPGSCRFNELRRALSGVSQRMLTLALRGLERDGLVVRTEIATLPPRVDYALSSLGHSLRAPVVSLGDWTLANHNEITAAQARFDAQAATAAT